MSWPAEDKNARSSILLFSDSKSLPKDSDILSMHAHLVLSQAHEKLLEEAAVLGCAPPPLTSSSERLGSRPGFAPHWTDHHP